MQKGVDYTLQIEYDNSVVSLREFDVCPHMVVEVSSISKKRQTEMRRLIDQDKGSQADSEFLLDGIFNMLNGERLEMDSPEDFRFVFEGDRTLQHEFIYKKDF